ncbi:24227_t:CDS:2, partial [Cetraspora pellucida]
MILSEQALLDTIDNTVTIDDNSIDLFNSSYNIILSEQASST